MITRAKISAVRANSFVVVEQFIMFFLVIRNSSNKRRMGGAALIRGRRLLTFLSQMRRLIEGGAYSNKYGKHCFWFLLAITMVPRENKTMLMQNLEGQTKSIMVFSFTKWQCLSVPRDIACSETSQNAFIKRWGGGGGISASYF